MRRLVVIILILFLFFLIGFSLFTKYVLSDRTNLLTQLIVPKTQNAEEIVAAQKDSSYVSLSENETLITSLKMDIDDDGYEDQIEVIKLNDSPFLNLYFSLYNPILSSYSKESVIQTSVTQIQSFSCYALDVLGNNKNAFVYQGVSDLGHSVLKILSGKREANGEFSILTLGDFDSVGTIFIQQSARESSYSEEEAPKTFDSYPVWVYEDVPSAQNPSQTDQIQTMYDWNPVQAKYVEVNSTRINGISVAEKNMSRIQDGKVSTFCEFLNGLWINQSSEKVARYIYFDYDASEIIFQEDRTEELYSWTNSLLKKNGIYFTAVNQSVKNLRRNFDITLINTDTVRISVRDDVRMNIIESNLWNGTYKKVSSQKENKPVKLKGVDSFAELSVPDDGWSFKLSDDDEKIIKFKEDVYEVSGKNGVETGRFQKTSLDGNLMLQLRSDSKKSSLTGIYIPAFTDETDVEKKSLALQKVIVNPDGFIPDKSAPLILTKVVKKDPNELASGEEVVEVKKAGPKLSVKTSPQYFSPDNDGKDESVTISLSAQSESQIKNWSFTVLNPNTNKPFWSTSGASKVEPKIVWDGRSASGMLVQSATDYPYEFSVTDSDGITNVASGMLHVDVLLMREGGKLKMQIPSIIFRSDHADFKSEAEVLAGPVEDQESKGLDQRTIENNIRVLKRIAEILKKFQDYRVTIEGNANNLSGSIAEEREVQVLSEQRARFVRDWLIRNGIEAKRLTAVGNGSKNPVALGDDLDSRRRNRRVDFILNK
ncbi:pallilysin-related adhesin [Treponema zioleckii]|uniref:pallilysin-related adhesin n=1 Tax=Treponema zioleckii TaxID=331680 RepID=UPI00168B3946|nr:pallilysin-related adhesin [Treponema zioleckii]